MHDVEFLLKGQSHLHLFLVVLDLVRVLFLKPQSPVLLLLLLLLQLLIHTSQVLNVLFELLLDLGKVNLLLNQLFVELVHLFVMDLVNLGDHHLVV